MTHIAAGTPSGVTCGGSESEFVTAALGDVITALLATPDQCRAFGLPVWSGKMLWSIAHPDGTVTLCPADGSRVTFGHPAAAADG